MFSFLSSVRGTRVACAWQAIFKICKHQIIIRGSIFHFAILGASIFFFSLSRDLNTVIWRERATLLTRYFYICFMTRSILRFALHEKYMILYKRACIGVPIGLLIFPSARTFAFEWPMCENKKKKKVRVRALYSAKRTPNLEILFIIAQICPPSNEKSLPRGRHPKK